MEEIFNLPSVQSKPPPETSSNSGSETVDGNTFQDTLDEKIQDASATEQEQKDELSMEAEAAASQTQQQIITVTNHAYDELVTPGREQEANNAALNDALMGLAEGTTQAEGDQAEGTAVVTDEMFLEEIMKNEEAPEKIKFAAELSKDVPSFEVEAENSLENPMDTTNGQVIEIAQVQIQTELQTAENAQEDTNLVDFELNVED